MKTENDILPTAPTYQPEDNFSWLVYSCISLLRQEIDRSMEPEGLTNAQWQPMLKMYRGQAGTVAELARACSQDAGGMTRMLDRLENKGLCKRARSESDRRIVHLHLTEEGRQKASTIPQAFEGINARALAALSDQEVVQLKDMLKRVIHSLKTGSSE